MRKTLLISVKPQYASLILGGTKTVELRRVRPSVTVGDRVAIYVSSPDRTLRAFALVGAVVAARPRELWATVGGASGLSRSAFLEYFRGAGLGYGIVLTRLAALPVPHSLPRLRSLIPKFSPPQGYRYLSEAEVGALVMAA